jgi:hypothetical protein
MFLIFYMSQEECGSMFHVKLQRKRVIVPACAARCFFSPKVEKVLFLLFHSHSPYWKYGLPGIAHL